MVGAIALAVGAHSKVRDRYPDLVPPDDPALDAMIKALRMRCVDEFQPSRRGGPDNYEAGCAAMALAAVSRTEFAPEMNVIAQYLLRKQRTDGSWSYDSFPTGDTSMTQYALLGLWECGSSGGGPIPMSAWDRAARWLVTHQSPDGGFGYHPPDANPGGVQTPSTHTMTAASLGSLYLCRNHLPGGKPSNPREILLPLAPQEAESDYAPQVEFAMLRAAIDRAQDWQRTNFTLDKARGEGDPGGGRWAYYYLYALERFATFAEMSQIGGVDWYAKAAALLIARQQPNGSWTGGHEELVDTCFASLFLVRSTQQSVQKVRLLGQGKLVPIDFTRKVSDERLFEFLSRLDTDAVTRWRSESEGSLAKPPGWMRGLDPRIPGLWKALQKGYEDGDTPLIIAALKGFAQTHDLRVVPILIDAMYYDADGRVQLAARDALALISRRVDGRYTGSSAGDWETEITKWLAWYRSVRPLAEFDDVLPSAQKPIPSPRGETGRG
jgi:hypothetical protein